MIAEAGSLRDLSQSKQTWHITGRLEKGYETMNVYKMYCLQTFWHQPTQLCQSFFLHSFIQQIFTEQYVQRNMKGTQKTLS